VQESLTPSASGRRSRSSTESRSRSAEAMRSMDALIRSRTRCVYFPASTRCSPPLSRLQAITMLTYKFEAR